MERLREPRAGCGRTETASPTTEYQGAAQANTIPRGSRLECWLVALLMPSRIGRMPLERGGRRPALTTRFDFSPAQARGERWYGSQGSCVPLGSTSEVTPHASERAAPVRRAPLDAGGTWPTRLRVCGTSHDYYIRGPFIRASPHGHISRLLDPLRHRVRRPRVPAMPVPIAVTHPQGAGLVAAKTAELPTEGPFARLARQRLEQQAAPAAGAPAASADAAGPGPQSASADAQQQQHQQQQQRQQDAAAAGGGDATPSIGVRGLDFSYPGLGEPVGAARGARCMAADGTLVGRPRGRAATWRPRGRPSPRDSRTWPRLPWPSARGSRPSRPPPQQCERHSDPARSPAPADGRPVPGQPPLISGMALDLAPGSRCLLIGANGAGKTTLLKILGGKHMVPRVRPGSNRVVESCRPSRERRFGFPVGVPSVAFHPSGRRPPAVAPDGPARAPPLPVCLEKHALAPPPAGGGVGAGPPAVPRHGAHHVRRPVLCRRQLDARHRFRRHRDPADGALVVCRFSASARAHVCVVYVFTCE
jgi:hypothetical protein